MIFNKNNEGAAELQRLVGNYFRSNDFSAIESEIKSAAGVVRRLIGPGGIRPRRKILQLHRLRYTK